MNFILGDSLSRSPGPGVLVGWPDQAFEHIEANFSVPGIRTGEMIEEAPWEESAGPGQTWWIMLGTNNTWGHPLQQPFYAADMETIILELVDHGVDDVRLISCPYIWNSYLIDRSEQRAMIDEQREIDLELCDFYAEVECVADLREMPNGQLFQADGVHFTDLGHAYVVTAIPEPGQSLLMAATLVTLGLLVRCKRCRRLRTSRGCSQEARILTARSTAMESSGA